MIKGTPKQPVTPELLAEATWRNVAQWALTLRLDPARAAPGDSFADWVRNSGGHVGESEEGGAVVRGAEGTAHYFIDEEQWRSLLEEFQRLMTQS